MLWLISAA
ncbi:hypothetical protein VCHC72A2_02659A, partial [Vibrio cholerae HC-72A2]